jgi:hypothetical protein
MQNPIKILENQLKVFLTFKEKYVSHIDEKSPAFERKAEIEKQTEAAILEFQKAIEILQKLNKPEPPAVEPITAEEFFRNKIKELHPGKKDFALSQQQITAEQGLRWAHEFKELHCEHQAAMYFRCKPFTGDMWSFLLVNARWLTQEQRAGLCYDLYLGTDLKQIVEQKIKEYLQNNPK